MDTIMLLCTLVLAGFYLLEGGGGGVQTLQLPPN